MDFQLGSLGHFKGPTKKTLTVKRLMPRCVLCSPPICVLIAYHLTKSGLLPEIPPLISVLSRTTN